MLRFAPSSPMPVVASLLATTVTTPLSSVEIDDTYLDGAVVVSHACHPHQTARSRVLSRFLCLLTVSQGDALRQ